VTGTAEGPRIRPLLLLALSAALAAAACTTAKGPEFGTFGIDLGARDTSVDPGDDFFTYANGAWLKSRDLKDDEKVYGQVIALGYRSERRVRAIIEDLVHDHPEPGSVQQKIADYYSSYMDVATLDAKGIEPLRPDLDRIAAIGSREQLVEALARAPVMETNAPFVARVDVDRKDPDQHLVSIENAGLGLPDRSYYLEEDFAEVRAAYRRHIAEMLAFTGLDEQRAASAAAEVLALETAIATDHWKLTELRHRDKTYNLFSLEQLEAAYPDYPWRRHLEAAGLDPARVERINLVAPSATAPLVALVNEAPLESWKHYLTYHLVSHHADLLGDAIDEANFAFRGRILGGQPEQRDRWKRGVVLVGGTQSGGPLGFGDAVGRMYVERHFSPRSKEMVSALVENLRAALRDRVETLDWMGPATRKQALAKLESFRPKIGYPSEWRDFSSVEIVPGDLMANYRAVGRYWYEDMTSRLGEPTDRERWDMTPQMVNAYYNPTFNEVVFPAAILQPPFFDPRADAAVNYGAIGAVIGHEMGHGFDDQGSKADAAGVERNWWTAEDRRRFEARAQALVRQYDAYEPIPGQHVNGELTLGENIGDLGGLSMAHRAYQLSLAGEPAPVLDGFTADQRFFLAWAQVWRQKYRDAFLLQLLKSDPHSPARYRVNGVVPNLDAWYGAFDVGPGDALDRPPEERVSIW